MVFGRRRNEASRPWRLSAKWLILCSIIIVAGFSAICADVVLDMRRGEEALVRRTLENMASGIDADINRNIDLYDLSLRSVASSERSIGFIVAGWGTRSKRSRIAASRSTGMGAASIAAVNSALIR